jgi:RNA polymerase sigma-70 factor (ECF subfamily)
MENALSSLTSPTLLGRLRKDPTDQAAWSEFVDRYGPKIYAWCRRWRLQEADAEDVTQTVLLKLADKMRNFAYDPKRSFRGWLMTLTHHAWSDFLKSRGKAGAGSGDSKVRERLESLQARDDLVTRLKEEFDREILEEATFRVRLKIVPQKWEVFRLMAHEEKPGAEVAKILGMKVATVFVVRSKVQKMLQEEVRKLEE